MESQIETKMVILYRKLVELLGPHDFKTLKEDEWIKLLTVALGAADLRFLNYVPYKGSET